MSVRICTLMVHNTSHNSEELLLNPEIFPDLSPGDFIQIYDPQNYEGNLILKVPNMPPISSRLEISLTKVVAESNCLKPFSKVIVDKIEPETASIDFVELGFKRQYLQRGNFFRLQNVMFGRTVYIGQNLAINGMQAQIQEIQKDSTSRNSGIITERTKFVFRSKSARIIWLVQISAEMWEFDQVRAT
jgi:DEP domain-containing protein 5